MSGIIFKNTCTCTQTHMMHINMVRIIWGLRENSSPVSSFSPGENRPSLITAGLMVNTCSEEVTLIQWLQFRISRNSRMETAQLPLCLSLNPPPSPKPTTHFKPPHSFPSNHQLNCKPHVPSIKVGVLDFFFFFSEEKHKQDRHMRWRRGEGKDESLDAGDQSAVAGKCTGSQAYCYSNINNDRLHTHIMCEYTFCVLEVNHVAVASAWTDRRTQERTWYHDNLSQSRLLSWRYESLPRTCENRHQTRTNKPHRKFFPHRRNWEKKGKEKRKMEWVKRKATEV